MQPNGVSEKRLKSKTPLRAKKPLVAKSKLPKKPKKHTVAWYKREARKWFNRSVKYRDSEFIEGEWLFQCITCNRRVLFKDREGRFYKHANAGHFQPETYSNLRYDETNVNAQCSVCNNNQGEQVKYARALDLKYGRGTADRLEKEAGHKQWTMEELLQIILEAKQVCKFYETSVQ